MKSLRRLAAFWCLAAMLAGEVAQAKVLIVSPRQTVLDMSHQASMQQQRRNLRLYTSIIRATGGEFRVMHSNQLKTEMLRTGLVYYDNAPTTSYSFNATGRSEQFDGVVLMQVASYTALQGQNVAGFARGDSLTLWAIQNRSGAAVNALAIGDNQAVVGGTSQWEESVRCTTGVVGTEFGTGYGKIIYWPGEGGGQFWPHAYVEGGLLPHATGDLRKILSAQVFKYQNVASFADNGGTVACRTCDSMRTTLQSDTLILWERQYGANPNKVATSGAKTIVFASAYGGGSSIDSLANEGANGQAVPNPGTEGDFTMILAGLARLDSLVRNDRDRPGGRVLGDKTIRIAPVVYGGLARGERHAWKSPGGAQGILDADTSAFYAILDSLDALGIPVTFAVNPDSAGSYARDIIKLKSVKNAHFTPQVWNGIADTATAGGQNVLYRPVDVFGRWRPRVAVGDLSGLGADSSMATLLKSSLRMTDSIFGKNRVSRIAVAPDDDWSPENLRIPASGFATSTLDSIILAMQRAGFHGVIADGQDPDARATKASSGPSAANPRGYLYEQDTFRNRAMGIDEFKILAHTGYNILGGRSQIAAFRDSVSFATALVTDGYASIFYKELSRLWTGALLDYDDAYDTWPYDAPASTSVRNYDNIQQRKVDRVQGASGTNRPTVHGSVYRLSCADLSGVPYGGPGGAPAATGYWVLKSANNAMRTINRLAGRTVVRWAYPDEIEP